MNITIRLTKVEHEMLKELQKKFNRFKSGLEKKLKSDLLSDYRMSFASTTGLLRSHGKEPIFRSSEECLLEDRRRSRESICNRRHL